VPTGNEGKAAPFGDPEPYALFTRPLLMQVVQALIRVATPLIRTLAAWRLGFQMCLVCLVEWLTLYPTEGFFPQISHFQDIAVSLLVYANEGNIYCIRREKSSAH